MTKSNQQILFENVPFVDNAKKHTSCSHELRNGEIWVGNTNVSEGIFVPSRLIGKLETARLGEQAYDIHGNPINRGYCRPVIINKSEEMIYDKIMMDHKID